MGQVSAKLRRATIGYEHWCPACEEMHILPDNWKFNGNVDKPTFTPSFKHTGVKTVNVNGEWTGEFIKDEKGNPVPFICHYILTDGMLDYCADSTHEMRGKVELPDLPEFIRDKNDL